jgi:small subunit ribosomal protein S17
MSETTSSKRALVGRVVSDKMEKTVTVLIERKVKHPMYGKVMVRSRKYHAHNEGNLAKAGDLVEIVETRPVSRTKSWAVTNVLQKAIVVGRNLLKPLANW